MNIDLLLPIKPAQGGDFSHGLPMRESNIDSFAGILENILAARLFASGGKGGTISTDALTLHKNHRNLSKGLLSGNIPATSADISGVLRETMPENIAMLPGIKQKSPEGLQLGELAQGWGLAQNQETKLSQVYSKLRSVLAEMIQQTQIPSAEENIIRENGQLNEQLLGTSALQPEKVLANHQQFVDYQQPADSQYFASVQELTNVQQRTNTQHPIEPYQSVGSQQFTDVQQSINVQQSSDIQQPADARHFPSGQKPADVQQRTDTQQPNNDLPQPHEHRHFSTDPLNSVQETKQGPCGILKILETLEAMEGNSQTSTLSFQIGDFLGSLLTVIGEQPYISPEPIIGEPLPGITTISTLELPEDTTLQHLEKLPVLTTFLQQWDELGTEGQKLVSPLLHSIVAALDSKEGSIEGRISERIPTLSETYHSISKGFPSDNISTVAEANPVFSDGLPPEKAVTMPEIQLGSSDEPQSEAFPTIPEDHQGNLDGLPSKTVSTASNELPGEIQVPSVLKELPELGFSEETISESSLTLPGVRQDLSGGLQLEKSAQNQGTKLSQVYSKLRSVLTEMIQQTQIPSAEGNIIRENGQLNEQLLGTSASQPEKVPANHQQSADYQQPADVQQSIKVQYLSDIQQFADFRHFASVQGYADVQHFTGSKPPIELHQSVDFQQPTDDQHSTDFQKPINNSQKAFQCSSFGERIGSSGEPDLSGQQEGNFQLEQGHQGSVFPQQGNFEGIGIKAENNYARDILPKEVLGQIIERVNLLARPGVQELRLQLQPEILGEVLIKMRRIKGLLSAEIMTQNIAVKELLEGNLEPLRHRFQQLNLPVEEFNVFVGGEDNSGSAFNDENNKPRSSYLPFGGGNAQAEEERNYFPETRLKGKVDCLV
jgi:flagellar hook-length control protein FliK